MTFTKLEDWTRDDTTVQVNTGQYAGLKIELENKPDSYTDQSLWLTNWGDRLKLEFVYAIPDNDAGYLDPMNDESDTFNIYEHARQPYSDEIFSECDNCGGDRADHDDDEYEEDEDYCEEWENSEFEKYDTSLLFLVDANGNIIDDLDQGSRVRWEIQFSDDALPYYIVNDDVNSEESQGKRSGVIESHCEEWRSWAHGGVWMLVQTSAEIVNGLITKTETDYLGGFIGAKWAEQAVKEYSF